MIKDEFRTLRITFIIRGYLNLLKIVQDKVSEEFGDRYELYIVWSPILPKYCAHTSFLPQDYSHSLNTSPFVCRRLFIGSKIAFSEVHLGYLCPDNCTRKYRIISSANSFIINFASRISFKSPHVIIGYFIREMFSFNTSSRISRRIFPWDWDIFSLT